MKRAAPAVALCLAAVAVACGPSSEPLPAERTIDVDVSRPDGKPLPMASLPLPVDLTGRKDAWDVGVTLRRADGKVDASASTWIRLSVHPGAIVSVAGAGGAPDERVAGRNVQLAGGAATVQVRITGEHGPTRIWAEDLGYSPAPADSAKPPACANGKDDDGDGFVDYPADPGCAFANDDTEQDGAYATGASQAIFYALPTLADLQGRSGQTPWPEDSVEVQVAPPIANVIVTRIAADGFYASDTNEKGGYGHVFAYTFNTPVGLRVCDRLARLTGTAADFFGFTELSFVTFKAHWWRFPTAASAGDGPCQVPEPAALTETVATDPVALEKLESGLVRLTGPVVSAKFGPDPAVGNVFGPTQSNCDLNGDGKVDFGTPGNPEADCSNKCVDDPDCSEWTSFASRGNFRVRIGGTPSLQVNTDEAGSGFSPPLYRGKKLISVTGTLRNFSGGKLNWTVETRCSDDLVYECAPEDGGCHQGPVEPMSSQSACIRPRTEEELASN